MLQCKADVEVELLYTLTYLDAHMQIEKGGSACAARVYMWVCDTVKHRSNAYISEANE